MAELFDIFNPPKTEVVKGVDGKIILIHSDGVKCGKTTVGSQMPKPFYLRFEQGANAIDGLPYAPLTSWSDFKKVNKMLCDTKPHKVGDKELTARELYSTIIFDTIDVAIKWCTKFVCSKYGVERLKDGNNGYGLWSEYADEWFSEVNKLMNAGYCLYFIAHSDSKKMVDGVTGEEYEQLVPKGDKRTTDLVVEAADFIGYVKPNGIDADGNIIKSSVYFAETKSFKAGSRFSYMPKYIEEFSAKNLQDAIKLAVEEEEKATGHKALTHEENKQKEAKKSYDIDEIKAEILKYQKVVYGNNQDEYFDAVEQSFGSKDFKPSEATTKQMENLENFLNTLVDIADKNGLEV